MSAIQRALADVHFRIPKRVLELAFITQYTRYRYTPTSIDNQISNLVIRPRVLVDCNLLGGDEAFVPLTNIEREQVDTLTTVFRIPKELTGGRSIVTVKSVNYIDPNSHAYYGVSNSCDRGGLLLMGKAIMDAMADIPPISSASVTLIGENSVMMRYNSMLPTYSWLRCVLEYDSNMSSINPRSYPYIAKLTEYAVKAFIYNELLIKLDEGFLHGGQDLGSIRTIVEGYSDANELYDEYRQDHIQKVLYMNDDERKARFIGSLIGGYR